MNEDVGMQKAILASIQERPKPPSIAFISFIISFFKKRYFKRYFN